MMMWNMAYILFVPQCEPLLYPVDELPDLAKHLKVMSSREHVKVCAVEYNALGLHVSDIALEHLL